MKFLLSSAFLCVLLTFSAFSQDTNIKPTIAVMPFIESDRAVYGGSEVTDVFFNELVTTSKFSVVDKARSGSVEPDLIKSIKETVDRSTATTIAEKTGAQFFILGNVTDYTEKMKTSLYGVKSYESTVKFNLRAVNSATSEVMLSQTFEKRGISVGDATKAMQEAVTKSVKDAVTALVKRLGSPAAAR